MAGPFWYVVQPTERTNILLNPSYERGTTGAFSLETATVGSTSQFQAFGAWSLSVTPSSVGTSGAILGTWTSQTGTAYTTSAYVRGAAGVQYCLDVRNNSSLNSVGSTAFTGGGTWQRVTFSYTEASPDLVRRLLVHKISGADTSTFYVDGAMVEVGSQTTYLDGDQDGCVWNGVPHASTSTRSGQSRSGGSVVALSDLGFTVEESTGIGMPPIANNALSYALADGAQFQHQRATERAFTLTSYIEGTTWQGLHGLRRNILDALKIDRVTPQQPTRFWYTGAGGTVQIDAVYDGGGEFGEPEGFTEHVSFRFVAYDPYWEATTQQGTALTPRISLGSTNYIAQRSPAGLWGTLGTAGTTTNGNIQSLAFDPNSGDLFLAGVFTTAGGTQAPLIARYKTTEPNKASPAQFGTLTGGTVTFNQTINCMTFNAAGTLFIGGLFTTAGGTAAKYIAQWNSAWGTLTNGTLSDQVVDMTMRAGTLCVVGYFQTAGGTQARYASMWVNGAWGTLTGGTLSDFARSITLGLDGKLYIGGAYNTVNGTVARGIARWDGAWAIMGSGFNSSVGSAGPNSLVTGPNGLIYAGGPFETSGQGTLRAAAQWNGVQWGAMGSGITDPGLVSPYDNVIRMVVDPLTGNILTGGHFSSIENARTVPPALAQWNGYRWLGMDIQLPGDPQCAAIAVAGDRTLYIAGTWAGTATAASVANVINSGMAQAYPILKARNTGSGTARLYQIRNYTTGDAIYFDFALEPGEEVTLTLTPGARSFTSSFRGTVFGNILPGSNLATFKLLPGTNSLSFFADSDSLQPSIYWTPRNWSADGGTTF